MQRIRMTTEELVAMYDTENEWKRFGKFFIPIFFIFDQRE